MDILWCTVSIIRHEVMTMIGLVWRIAQPDGRGRPGWMYGHIVSPTQWRSSHLTHSHICREEEAPTEDILQWGSGRGHPILPWVPGSARYTSVSPSSAFGLMSKSIRKWIITSSPYFYAPLPRRHYHATTLLRPSHSTGPIQRLPRSID